MIIAAQIISAAGDFWSVQNCAKLLDVIGDAKLLVEQYPSCVRLVEGGDLKAVAAVNANFGGTAVELMSAMNSTFGMAGWIATSLHAIGVEVYVSHVAPVRRKVERVTDVLNSSTLLPRSLSAFELFPTNDRSRLDLATLAMPVWSRGIVQ